MRIVSLAILVGLSVLVAGCTQLLAPASNLGNAPQTEGNAQDSAEASGAGAISSGSSRQPGPGLGLPNGYSSLLTPLAGQAAVSDVSKTEPAQEQPDNAPLSNQPGSVQATPTVQPATGPSQGQPSQLPATVAQSTPTPSAMPTSGSPAMPTATPAAPESVVGDGVRLELLFEKSAVAVGEKAEAVLQLSEAPEGLSGFDVIITAEPNGVARWQSGKLESFGLSSVSDLPSETVQVRAVDLGGNVVSTSETVTFGMLTLEGQAAGTVQFSFEIIALDDDTGSRIEMEIVAPPVTVQ